jgi:ribosome maturation factor RimP
VAEKKSGRPGTEEIIARVEELVLPLLVSLGLELVETQLQRPRRGRATLRLFADRAGGITLEELTRVSRVVGQLLEVHDLIPGPYTLEVSSPGLTRELKKPGDYQRYAGRLVRLTTRALWEGRQVHIGILKGLEGGQVSLETAGQVYLIPLEEIARARLDIDWKNLRKEG